MTLPEFLLARIADEEVFWQTVGELGQAHPDRVKRYLAECEAKRQIVFQYEFADRAAGGDSAYQLSAAMLRTALSHLALPYADHDDYREEWR